MELKPGYKQTEVGVIPEDWEVVHIGDLGTVVRGGSPRPAGDPKYFNGNYIPWLTVAALTTIPAEHMHVISTVGFLTEQGSKHSRTLNIDTIIIANSGATLGVAKVLRIKCCANDGIAAVINQKFGNKEFICHLINFKTKYLRDVVATGNGQPNLNTTLIKNLQIPFPPAKEQQAIAAVLSDMDDLLAKMDQLLAKKRNIKQAAMQELLTGKRRLPGFSGEWKEKSLGQVARIQRGASPRPIDSPVWFDQNSTIGWVRISDVTRSKKHLSETKQKLSKSGVLRSRFVATGGLIMSICATVGKPMILAIDACIHDGFVVFNHPTEHTTFLFYLLTFMEEKWSKDGQTGSQMNLNTGIIAKAVHAFPPVDEQAAIAAVLSDMDAEIAELEARREKTSALKQGMMQELLTGRIRLVPPAHAGDHA